MTKKSVLNLKIAQVCNMLKNVNTKCKSQVTAFLLCWWCTWTNEQVLLMLSDSDTHLSLAQSGTK